MATINRAPWTALVDDDGSNLVGSIWNKDAIKTVLLDPIDAALLEPPPAPTTLQYSQLQFDLTGNYDNFRPPNGENAVVWILTPLVATNITGFLAEADRTQHLIINDGNAPLVFHNNHSSSSAGNRLYVPGFATTYSLNLWSAIWMTYLTRHNGWLLLKAS